MVRIVFVHAEDVVVVVGVQQEVLARGGGRQEAADDDEGDPLQHPVADSVDGEYREEQTGNQRHQKQNHLQGKRGRRGEVRIEHELGCEVDMCGCCATRSTKRAMMTYPSDDVAVLLVHLTLPALGLVVAQHFHDRLHHNHLPEEHELHHGEDRGRGP